MASSPAATRITIRVNGESQATLAGSTVSTLLEELGLAEDQVAVERNREIVGRDEWETTVLEAGDRLEIVHFVGGG